VGNLIHKPHDVVSSSKDGKMLRAHAMVFRKVREWAKTNKGPFKGSACSCLNMI